MSLFSEECILGVNFVMREAEDLEVQGSSTRVVVTVCVLLVLFVGGGIFLFLNARSKSLAIAPKTKAGGYEKLDTNGEIASKPTTSSFGEYSDRIIDCDNDNEDDDDDIVYMAQDGTVYRRFKYGLLDDDEVELEYDDESYSYKWKVNTIDQTGKKQLLPITTPGGAVLGEGGWQALSFIRSKGFSMTQSERHSLRWLLWYNQQFPVKPSSSHVYTVPISNM